MYFHVAHVSVYANTWNCQYGPSRKNVHCSVIDNMRDVYILVDKSVRPEFCVHATNQYWTSDP
jgi:hypothetical protein